MRKQLAERAFWIKLRDETAIKNSTGASQCSYWCRRTIERLDEIYADHGFSSQISFRDTPGNVWHEIKPAIWFHKWLATTVGERRFIADGTAGQIDSRYKRGFYGFSECASPRLRLVYDSKLS